MDRRTFTVAMSTAAVTALAGCAGSETPPDEEAAPPEETATDEQETRTHAIGESFVVGDGARSIRYRVVDYEVIEDYIFDPDFGETPDGVFVAVILEMENVGEESLTISSEILQLADAQDRQFDADTAASIFVEQDPRVDAEGITFDQLQPGLTVTRAIVFDVPPGSYRFVAEPAGVFSGADEHAVPLGDV